MEICRMQLGQDLSTPLYVYFQLEKFYQNHRRYTPRLDICTNFTLNLTLTATTTPLPDANPSKLVCVCPFSRNDEELGGTDVDLVTRAKTCTSECIAGGASETTYLNPTINSPLPNFCHMCCGFYRNLIPRHTTRWFSMAPKPLLSRSLPSTSLSYHCHHYVLPGLQLLQHRHHHPTTSHQQ